MFLVIIDRWYQRVSLVPFVGMPISDAVRRPKMGWFYMVVCMGHHTNYP